jgi:hypothetical protein
MQGILGRIVLGFIAAAISVLIVHEGIIYLLNAAGYIPGRGWSMTPAIPPWGVPRLVNNVFWGGLWGVLFALVYEWVPGGWSWLKGLIYGLFIVVWSQLGPAALIKGWIFGCPIRSRSAAGTRSAHADRGLYCRRVRPRSRNRLRPDATEGRFGLKRRRPAWKGPAAFSRSRQSGRLLLPVRRCIISRSIPSVISPP